MNLVRGYFIEKRYIKQVNEIADILASQTPDSVKRAVSKLETLEKEFEYVFNEYESVKLRETHQRLVKSLRVLLNLGEDKHGG